MILFISAWHLVSVLGVSLAFAAFVGVSALLWFLWDIWQQIEDEKSGAEQRKRDRRSAGAKQGWQTRKAKLLDGDQHLEDEVERVLRTIDAQAEARGE